MRRIVKQLIKGLEILEDIGYVLVLQVHNQDIMNDLAKSNVFHITKKDKNGIKSGIIIGVKII